MACTTLLVGKEASFDGSTIISRSEDSPSGIFTAKRFIVVKPEDQPRKYESVLSGCKVDLPDNPMRYTALPNSDTFEGDWAASGVNEKNISMSATETITTNARVQGADPLIQYPTKEKKCGGIGEEDFVTLVLPYINSAREGVERLGKLLEEHGTYESNGIAFQDVDEIWWLETIGGHHWMARRVPDDAYVVMPNQLGIDYFDFDDAYGEQKEFMCSKDLKEWSEKHHLFLDQEDYVNPRLAYGSHDHSDHTYNTPRAWIMLRYFNPNTLIWDGEDADFTPESDDLPWAMVPERKITVEDMKTILSSHYEGTPYDCYAKHGDPNYRGMYRPLGISRDNVTHFTQIRPYAPEEIRAIQWLSFGSNAFNAAVAFYANVETTPSYVGDQVVKATSENFYWANRIIAALCDAHFNKTAIFIERYQGAVQSKSNEIINKYDEEFAKNSGNVHELLEKANQEMADFLKEKTDKLLHDVLFTASCEMKNGFARSDN
ncbi:C69 family dipeptidase [Finegoldia magna]|uniref:C69 family dipeptidase n=1 Tax=Finegoldia magna TaxID=1260 RepID=UPI0029063C8F|nr:C69 family dipeptidase [Finegoldia magna]MDU6598905.1 C69 family dipeptidase [Finegoldia magna]